MLAGDLRRKTLNKAVADDPQGQKTTNLCTVPSQRCTQINRQGNNKPDIPCPEQEQARGREGIDRPTVGKQLGKSGFSLRLANLLIKHLQAQ